jgi:predicted nucleotidyltransferase
MSLLRLDPDFKPAFDGPQLAQELIYKVAASLPLEAAFLFGSASRQKNTPDSDLDIILVVPEDASIKEYYRFVNQPFFSRISVDWIIKTKTEFENEKMIGGVSMVAFQTGIELKANDSK